jgi:hypothetical protein
MDTAAEGPLAVFRRQRRIRLWVKILYTGFLCVLVPCYGHDYGPTNFLYFCDVALFMTLAALWSEKAIWASMPAVGILLPQAVWMVDFLGGFVGWQITGMTAYMFSPAIPLFTRGLSLFHFWLPLFLVWVLSRLGYDRRAWLAWTVLAWVLMLVCYFLMPAPPAPADNPNLPVNINYVYGISDTGPQKWLPPLIYLAVLMVGLPLGVFLPTHLLLRLVFRPSESIRRRSIGDRSIFRPGDAFGE